MRKPMTLYLDIIFLINLAADFTLNFTCTVLAERKISLKKNFLISLAGALYGSGITCFPFIGNVFVAFIYSCFNIFLLFGKGSLTEFIRHMIIYYFVCIITGGVCNFFTGDSNVILLYNRSTYTLTKDICIFSALFIVCIFSNLFKAVVKYRKLYYQVILKSKDNSLKCTAFYDTGNTLSEPVTGNPVIIISKKTAEILGCEKEGNIQCNTISESNLTLDLVKIEELIFYEENYSIKNICCGISKHENISFDVILHKETYPSNKTKGLVENCSF